ncbi:MAG TPA: hypothetical protein VFK10_13360 [Burkholderiaceae bacterium]|nr:hypothetical protein [Burkholderiaceae bacterium]
MNARRIILVAPLALMASVPVQALSIVRAPSNVALGAPLNFPINVQLASDESINSTCVTADVQQGDQRMAPSTVRTSIEQGGASEERVVRVYSTVAIEEPVVTVTLMLGCAIRLERRFTVFADPPLVTVAATEPAEPPRVDSTPTPAPPARRETTASAPRTDTVTTASDGPLNAPSPRSDRKPAARTSRSTGGASAGASATPARPAVRTAAAAPTMTSGPTATAGARGDAPRRNTTPVGPRLKLDPLEPVAPSATAASAATALQEAQLRVAAMAASAAIAEQAASAALANAAAAAERMRALEQGLEKLRADAERDREQTAALRMKLAQAESAGRLTAWLGAALVGLAALAMWLWLRMRRLQRDQQAAWWAATKGAAASKAPPLNPPTLQPMTLPPSVAPPPLVKPEATVTVKPQAPPKPAFRDSLFTSQQEPRDVSIEELIDLEQQAEFFVVLGQDDAAIDLLMGHIRSSGGTSPLPYLKLLEIYRRQGDRDSYERTRERFNHRFNAYAPDWDFDLQHGRSLDEYPAVMQRLVARWRDPLDAMAELEALMFRRDGGELFELPAYREVLFLYSMARDLLDHQGGPPTTTIDVLLPLGDREAEFEPTTARPHLFTTPTGLAELSRASEPPIEVLHSSYGKLPAGEGPSSVYGPIDVDLTKPLPIGEDTQVLRREDDQRSDFLDLPPIKPK